MGKELLLDSSIEIVQSRSVRERFIDPVIKHWARITACGGLALTTILSPIDSPKPVKAESNQSQAGPDSLHGDGALGKTTFLYLPYNGTTRQMLIETKEDTFLISPTNEFKDKVNIYTINPLEDLKCDQNGICDWGAIDREIKRFIATYGLIPNETLVVVRSNDGGGAGQAKELPSRSVPPEIYSSSTIVRPTTAWKTPERRKASARLLAEELWGHAFAGFDHEGEDLMEKGDVYFFNDPHTQFLRRHFALVPFNYLTPDLRLIPNGRFVSVAGAQQSLEMSFELHAFSPTGTIQLYSELIPYNNDGAGVFDYVYGPLGIQAWIDAGRKIPSPPQWYGLLPDMTYTWRARVSGLVTPLVDQNGNVLKDDPRWDTVEGWPGVMFPNPAAEIKVKTPKRDSSRIGLVTLSGGQETNNLTPTLVWENGDKDVFYYEVQVSKDATFNTDPSSATAMVYWELRHGGVTNPNNSYTISPEFPLEKGTAYFWRVRPRIQGDGTPVGWSPAGSFKTSSEARVLSAGELEVIRNNDSIQAKKVISTEEHFKLQEQIREEEQERNQTTALHWQRVEREVLTKTEIPIFGDNGEIITWINHSDNISLEAYRKEEELTLAA